MREVARRESVLARYESHDICIQERAVEHKQGYQGDGKQSEPGKQFMRIISIRPDEQTQIYKPQDKDVVMQGPGFFLKQQGSEEERIECRYQEDVLHRPDFRAAAVGGSEHPFIVSAN